MADKYDPSTTIIFEDSMMEILYNPSLSKNPYLVRLHGYMSGKYETRMSCEELRELADFINNYLENN